MPTFLSDIELDEVSLVDRPANQHAKVILMKADGRAGRDGDGDGVTGESDKKKSGIKRKLKNAGRFIIGDDPVSHSEDSSSYTARTHRSRQDTSAPYLARTSQIIQETRGEPTGALLGTLFGAGVGAGAGAYIGSRSRGLGSLINRTAPAFGQKVGSFVGSVTGKVSGRVLGGAFDTLRGKNAGSVSSFGNRLGSLFGAVGSSAGKVTGKVVGSGVKLGLHTLRRAAGSRGVAGLAGAGIGAYFLSGPSGQAGSKLGQLYDQFSSRRVLR
jgi:hypothetical protein